MNCKRIKTLPQEHNAVIIVIIDKLLTLFNVANIFSKAALKRSGIWFVAIMVNLIILQMTVCLFKAIKYIP